MGWKTVAQFLWLLDSKLAFRVVWTLKTCVRDLIFLNILEQMYTVISNN